MPSHRNYPCITARVPTAEEKALHQNLVILETSKDNLSRQPSAHQEADGLIEPPLARDASALTGN